jgi:hypothetical protein
VAHEHEGNMINEFDALLLDCMIPDGGEGACKAYLALQAENEALRSELIESMETRSYARYIEAAERIRELKAENEALRQAAARLLEASENVTCSVKTEEAVGKFAEFMLAATDMRQSIEGSK